MASSSPSSMLRLLQQRCLRLFHTKTQLHHSIQTAIEAKNYSEIPHLLHLHAASDPNPFSFLRSLPPTLTVKIVDTILQSSLSIRPRSIAYPLYTSLLSFSLPNPEHYPEVPTSLLPLSLAVLQTSVRAGFPVPPDASPALASLWTHIRRRRHRLPVSRLLSSIRDIGYRPDLNTFNYLIASLSSASEVDEAVRVLQSFREAGCIPDPESYCTVIEAACNDERVELTGKLMRDMVVRERMALKKGMAWRVVRAMRRAGNARLAVEFVKFLEKEGQKSGFEVFEEVLEGCVEKSEFVIAGKLVVEMTNRGFIPYIEIRQKVIDGLERIGQYDLSSAVRQKLTSIGS